MFFTCPLVTIKPIFWSDLFRPLGTAPKAPTTTVITSTFRVAQVVDISYFRSWYFSIFSVSFELTLQSAGTATSIILQTLSSFPTISDLQACMMWSHYMLRLHKNLILSIANTLCGWCSNHLSAVSNPFTPHNSQWPILATLSCLFLYSFCASLLSKRIIINNNNANNNKSIIILLSFIIIVVVIVIIIIIIIQGRI